MLRPNWKNIVLNFTPSWFAVNMGTGILSTLIQIAPHQFNGQQYISLSLYLANCVLFMLFTVITIARYTMFPWVAKRMLFHPTQCMFLGTFPMGLATIVNGTVLMVVPRFGQWAVTLSWSLWWIDVALTVLSVIVIPILMFEFHNLTLQSMTAAWLLPLVPAVVAAASGGLIATALTVSQAYTTLIVSYVLWGMGICLSFLVMALYLHRIMVHNLPNHEVIVSAFLPLGPMGQGSYGIVQLGKAAKLVLDKTDTASASDIGTTVDACSTLVGLIIWGCGLWWLCHGITSVIVRACTAKLVFNMGFWGFIFPLGVFTSATINLSNQLSSEFFSILSLVFLVALIILYLAVMTMTLRDAFNSKLFKAPCLSDMNIQLGRPEASE